MRIYTKTITSYFIKLATELTVRSNYKPQKVTTLRMSQAGVSIFSIESLPFAFPCSSSKLALGLRLPFA